MHDLDQCQSKLKYVLKKRADKEAERMAVVHAEKFNAYQCTVCGYYHVGRTNKWLKQGS